jgi:regulator of cell morphogenesis and NO signaling
MADEVQPAPLLEHTVDTFAALDLRACVLFADLHWDLHEDGRKSVAEACRSHGIDSPPVADALAILGFGRVAPDVAATPWWAHDETCARLDDHHHVPLRAALTALNARGGEAGVPGRRLYQLVDALTAHFAKEENILFPAFAALTSARRQGLPRPSLPFTSVVHPIRVMEADHARIERDLALLREDAQDPLRDALERFARELSAHARFENEVLFPRALELERSLV